MAESLRHVPVAVGVVFDPEAGFLLFHNDRWKGYAFAMKKCPADVEPADAALAALDDDSPLRFPEAAARPVAVVGAFGTSGRTGEETYYDYQVHELDPGPVREGPVADTRAKFFSYDKLLASPEVTWSAKEIARAMVEFQEVSVGLIQRQNTGGREFLLVYHPSYGYFFPTARRKTGSPPEDMAVQAVHWDTGYTGTFNATWRAEVPDVHESSRFGVRKREYRFHICPIDVCGVDLTAADNPLATSLEDLAQAMTKAKKPLGPQGYWGWFTEEQLRAGTRLSPTTAVLLPAVLA